LDSVIVEKYYVSDANDSAASIGTLPVGSVTYRIYLDMQPSYKFQMAYGNANHPLTINTTTSFFNNEDRGAITPSYTKNQSKNNTVMLDSWLSAGAACVGTFGVLKSADDGVANVVNADGILANTNPAAGIPLTTQDGFLTVTGRTPGVFGTLGIDSAISVFDAISQMGNSFTITNGAWYCLAGAMGPDTVSNKILIAQITTEGTFSFQLNIQIGTPSGGTENYVASNPTMYNGQMEITIPSLTYTSVNIDTTSIQTQEINDDVITIYPNPSNGLYTLNIKSSNLKSQVNNYCKIYDIFGNIVMEKRIENFSLLLNDRIDLTPMAKGIYFAELSINGLKRMIRLIKD
jgi:hypothetical protein